MDPGNFWVQKHLLLEHINSIDQLIYYLAALLADAFVVLKNILRAYIRRAQVIEDKLLKFLLGVVIIDSYQVFSVPSITGKILKVFFCQHNLVFNTLRDHRLRLIHVFTCSGELL